MPTPVPSLQGIRLRSVSASDFHSLALSDQGVVFSFGSSGEGALGHGDMIDVVHTPKAIEALPPAVAVSAGPCHSLVLAASGGVLSFGSNFAGQSVIAGPC